MKRLLIPLLAFFIVGCSTGINEKENTKMIKLIFEFQQRVDRDGKDACESLVWKEMKVTQKILFLENKLQNKGYLSKTNLNKIERIRDFCGEIDFTLD